MSAAGLVRADFKKAGKRVNGSSRLPALFFSTPGTPTKPAEQRR